MTKLLINLKIKLIRFYKYLFSPLLGGNCRYITPCSEYYIVSLKKHGLYKGTFIGIRRIFSCHPFKILGGGSDYDFVPDHAKANRKK
jgi:putative membrane protein insertion efficiency factor